MIFNFNAPVADLFETRVTFTTYGRIVRLQIQESSLKVGPPRGRAYDPAPIRSVERLKITPDGASAIVDGAEVIDVHNALHPSSKNRDGINDLSLAFSSNYDKMRAKLGDHLVDGIAGESILVDSDAAPSLEELAFGLEIETESGDWIVLVEASVAHPCVEFSRFCLGPERSEPRQIKETLQFLDDGMRGYYLGLPDVEPVEIALGARVRWSRFGID